jgi:PAS domain S-box-containing protein
VPPLIPALVAVLISLLLTAALAWMAWSGNETRDRSRFLALSLRADAAIETRLELYIGMLRAGAGLFTASNGVNSDDFRAFAEAIDLPTNYPGVQGIGFARRVRPGEVAAFEAEARAEFGPGFELRPPGARDEYFPIQFLEPLDRRNAHAVGFDMFSDPVRRDAMERARDLGRPAATGRVVLVQEIDPEKQAGFLIYAPVYRGRDVPPTVEERQQAIMGFVYSPFRADDLFAGILGADKIARLRLEVHDDGPSDSEPRLLHRSSSADDAPARFTRATTLEVADRRWHVLYETTPAYETGFGAALARWIAGAGLAASVAVGSIVLAWARSSAEIRAHGRELARHREQLRVTLASIGDAVISTDDHGRIVFINRVAETLTGWAREEALGRSLSEVVPLRNEDNGQPVRNPVDIVLRDGATVELANHTVLVRRDGGSVPIEDSAAPIRDEDGRLVGVVLVFHDVTLHRRSEQELRASEERWRLAVETTRLGAWDLDPRAGELHWDARCRELLGDPPAGAVDAEKLFADLPHPDDRSRVFDALRQALRPGGDGRCEVECRGRTGDDGREPWLRLTGRAYSEPGLAEGQGAQDDAGTSVRRFIGTLQDITEEKRRERSLRFLVELGAATQRLDEPDEILRATARLLCHQLAADDCAFEPVAPPAAPAPETGSVPAICQGEECLRHLTRGDPFIVDDCELDPRLLEKDRSAWLEVGARALVLVPLHRSGRLVAVMSARQRRPRRWGPDEIALIEMAATRCGESVERARALRTLRESEARFRFLAEAMPQKICTTRPDGNIDYVNRQWADFTGAGLERLLGWGWTEIIHPEDLPRHLDLWRRSLETGRSFHLEHRLRRHDGQYRWHLTRVRPMREPDGRVSMWIGSSTDITDIVQARETLAERREELERLVRERTASLREAVEQMEEFSYSISHDLRSPLRAMQGYAQALLDDHSHRLDEEGRGHLRRIIAASTRMDRLTQDVLTYSRVARADAAPRRVDTERLVADCLQQYVEPRAAGAEIEVEHPLHEVVGHEPLLMQALSNLVGNALKFVPPGERPRVRIRTERNDDLVRLWVEDEGIGIPPEHQKRIWGMFERVHPKSGYEGTGIGLAIVRKAVERMGGRIGVESRGRGGSRFWIELPAPAREFEPALAEEDAATGPPAREQG